MANMEQLDALLQSLQALKPPGATKGKITAITKLCGDNVQVMLSTMQLLWTTNSQFTVRICNHAEAL
jgi:protein NRD1